MSDHVYFKFVVADVENVKVKLVVGLMYMSMT